MAEYIKREDAIAAIRTQHLNHCNFGGMSYRCYSLAIKDVDSVPAADVITRDDGIRLGAELAAMHGSDATSQDLEKEYWRGFEDAMQKRDVQPVKHGRWVRNAVYVDETTGEPCLAWFCNQCGEPQMVGTNFCPNCGARMDGEA